MKIFALLSICAAIVMAVLLEGNILHMVLLLAAMFYLVIPATLIVGVWSVVSARRQTWRPWFTAFWRVAGLVTLSVVLSGLAGFGFHEWRVRQTRDYVARAVLALDEHHSMTGRFPASLPVDRIGEPPKWLRGSSSFFVNSQDFRFEYWDPQGMMDGYEFTSETREWIYFD